MDTNHYKLITPDHLLCLKCESSCMKFAYTTGKDYEEGKRVFMGEHDKSCWKE